MWQLLVCKLETRLILIVLHNSGNQIIDAFGLWCWRRLLKAS